MTAAKIVLQPIFEATFLPVSFGFRPGRSAHDALEAIRTEANRGADWVLDADLQDCFGSLDRDAVIGLVAERVSDRDMLKRVRAWQSSGEIGNSPGFSDLPAALQRGPPRSGPGV